MTLQALTRTEQPAELSDWRWVSSVEVRQGDHPPVPAPIPGLLEGRVTLLAGAGGAGKTTLTEQIIRHLCSDQPLGRFDRPENWHRGWCLNLEDVEAMAQDRSLRVAPFGSIWEDEHPNVANVRYLFGRGFRPWHLEEELHKAEQDNKVPGIVIIDHLRILIGSQPAGIGPNDWERRNLLRLVDMADRYGTHIVVLTHLNKEGKVSGTTELINSVDTAYVIEPNPEDRSYATLACKKMRMSPEVDYALIKKMNGTWGFTDQVLVSETQAIGAARDIVRVLAHEGRKTLSELCAHPRIDAERRTIQTALTRGRKRGHFRLYRGHWEANVQDGDMMLRPPEQDPQAPPATPVPVPVPGPRSASDGEAAGAAADEVAAAPPAGNTDDDQADAELDGERWWDVDQADAETDVFKGLDVLKRSINDRSTMHPIPVIPKALRGDAPWSLFTTEVMGGEPSWTAEGWTERRYKETDADGRRRVRRELIWPESATGTLLLLDRNGSFPSACSSVPLAPNKLIHRGPQDFYDKDLAGLYLVRTPEWEHPELPHPLGRIVRPVRGQVPEQVWITTPHMAWLNKLADRAMVKRPSIIDSYLGRANTSLFDGFYKECGRVRLELVDKDGGNSKEYKQYKASLSSALRLLWPKERRSPFWRPDWRLSMVAEASVRHWLTAEKAVQAIKRSGSSTQLVSMANTDEVAFLTQDGQLPEPYVKGVRFGEVKIKKVVVNDGGSR